MVFGTHFVFQISFIGKVNSVGGVNMEYKGGRVCFNLFESIKSLDYSSLGWREVLVGYFLNKPGQFIVFYYLETFFVNLF